MVQLKKNELVNLMKKFFNVVSDIKLGALSLNFNNKGGLPLKFQKYFFLQKMQKSLGFKIHILSKDFSFFLIFTAAFSNPGTYAIIFLTL
jgi:hypothetical protein